MRCNKVEDVWVEDWDVMGTIKGFVLQRKIVIVICIPYICILHKIGVAK